MKPNPLAAQPQTPAAKISPLHLAFRRPAALLGWVAGLGLLAATASAQVAASHAGLSVSSVNGDTVVSQNGKELWKGKADHPKALSSSVNGQTLAAVLDGDKVLWESEPGAAAKIQKHPAVPKAAAHAGLSVSSVNGKTVVTRDGKSVWTGTAQHPKALSSSVNGQSLAAVLDGDKVLWESEPGAAAKIQKTQ